MRAGPCVVGSTLASWAACWRPWALGVAAWVAAASGPPTTSVSALRGGSGWCCMGIPFVGSPCAPASLVPPFAGAPSLVPLSLPTLVASNASSSARALLRPPQGGGHERHHRYGDRRSVDAWAAEVHRHAAYFESAHPADYVPRDLLLSLLGEDA